MRFLRLAVTCTHSPKIRKGFYRGMGYKNGYLGYFGYLNTIQHDIDKLRHIAKIIR